MEGDWPGCIFFVVLMLVTGTYCVIKGTFTQHTRSLTDTQKEARLVLGYFVISLKSDCSEGVRLYIKGYDAIKQDNHLIIFSIKKSSVYVLCNTTKNSNI